jgi:hypothetical protein
MRRAAEGSLKMTLASIIYHRLKLWLARRLCALADCIVAGVERSR